MAVIARRTWAQLRAETIQACGGHNYTGFSTRVEHWLVEAYYDLALTYHHHELEGSATGALVTGTPTLALPADCFIVIVFILRAASGGAYMKTLNYERLNFIQASYSGTNAEPVSFARTGATLHFNCPPSANYNYTLYYYKVPAAPDFAGSASPAIAWLWDSHLIDAALAKFHGRVWRPDLVGIETQTLKDWLEAQVQPTLTQELQSGLPDFPTANLPQGGPQG